MDEEDDYYMSCGSDQEDDSYSSDDEVMNGIEQDVSNGDSSNVPSSKLIRKESLLDAQKGDLEKVMDMLSVKEHHARTLLIHYRWDVQQLSGVYAEKGKSFMFSEAGVVDVAFVDINPPEASSMMMCNICMDDMSEKDMTRMDCSHSFCNTCWTGHFVVKINEGQSKRIKCMAHKCNAICDETIVKKLVGVEYPDLAEKFDRFLLESYIEDNKKAKWCPSTPHCGNAILVEDDESCEVECSCGFQFCFSCASEAHSPCSCAMWRLWVKKCQDESETVNWITVNTKPCPKCLKPVEKNGGCNLVGCVCGQAFCWLCGGATGRDHTYTSIANHSCGRYKEDSEKRAERAKRDLYRYMHYHNRYKAHTDSIKQESELQKSIMDTVEKLQDKSSLRDFTWVKNGLYRLFRSRRALAHSYPFAFYMFGDDLLKCETEQQLELKKSLFEDQQQQLESNVEKLSKNLEEKFDDYSEEQVMEVKMQVLNLSAITDNLCKTMYDCIENDLLGTLLSDHSIAPYNSNGIPKAEELTIGRSTHTIGYNNESQVATNQYNGFSTEASTLGSEDNMQPPCKRARIGTTSGTKFDLNDLPQEINS